jgi:hypothetical protein
LAQRAWLPVRTKYTVASLPLLSERMTSSITPSSIRDWSAGGVFMNPYWTVRELSSRQTAQRHMSRGYPEVA